MPRKSGDVAGEQPQGNAEVEAAPSEELIGPMVIEFKRDALVSSLLEKPGVSMMTCRSGQRISIVGPEPAGNTLLNGPVTVLIVREEVD